MPSQDFINRQALTQDGSNKLSNASFVNASALNVASGSITDIYTCPSGKKAALYNTNIYTPSSSTVNWYFKSGGNYYVLDRETVNGGNDYLLSGIVLDAGEGLSVDTTVSGLNIWFSIIEFDDDVPLKSVKTLSLSTGDNTVYTCPSGKTAIPYWDNLCRNLDSAAVLTATNGVSYQNSSGTTRTIHMYCVPNGGSTATTNEITNGARSISNGNHGNNRVIPYLTAGDYFVVNVDANTATQWVYVTVWEL